MPRDVDQTTGHQASRKQKAKTAKTAKQQRQKASKRANRHEIDMKYKAVHGHVVGVDFAFKDLIRRGHDSDGHFENPLQSIGWRDRGGWTAGGCWHCRGFSRLRS